MRDIFGFIEIEERRITSLFKEVSASHNISIEDLTLKDITHSFGQSRLGLASFVIFECEYQGSPLNLSLPFDHFMSEVFSDVSVML